MKENVSILENRLQNLDMLVVMVPCQGQQKHSMLYKRMTNISNFGPWEMCQ